MGARRGVTTFAQSKNEELSRQPYLFGLRVMDRIAFRRLSNETTG